MNDESLHQARNVLVQGASRGIGLEIARQLAQRPDTAQLVATCRSPDGAGELRTIVAASNSTVVALDAADEASIRAAAERVGGQLERIDLLINCAGLLHDGPLQPERRLKDVAQAHLIRSFNVNAFGPLLVAKHFEPLLIASQQALFASVSARVGSIADNRLGGWYGYRASKAAQNMFTKNLAIEWSRRTRPIICLALHPGTVATDLSEPFRGRADPSKVFDVQRAASQLLAIIDKATPADNGHFIAWDGTRIPW